MPANGRSLNPVFSADGQTPVWESWANNLAGQDINQWCNPYILQTVGTNLTAGAGQSFATAGFGVSSLASLGLARKLLDGSWHDRLSEVLSSHRVSILTGRHWPFLAKHSPELAAGPKNGCASSLIKGLVIAQGDAVFIRAKKACHMPATFGDSGLI